MAPAAVLLAVPGLLVITTLVAAPLARRLGRRAGHVLAAGPLVALVALLTLLPEALHTPIEVGAAWLPALGADWSLRLDGLSLVFAAMVLAVGVVVLSYSAGYLEDDAPTAYYALLSAFATAMTVLVLAGDGLTLYVGWEGTTLSSFGLIALAPEGRGPARRALLLTFGGGLSLLAGLLLASAHLGALRLAALADSAAWSPGALRAFLLLLVVAAAAKSAQPPFHIWLPGAMVAPTPVSAYLHAAAMVTAGLYLLLRFAAPIGSDPLVAGVVVALGTFGALFGAAAALRRDDLKELLAYSTISHLGFMIALVGIGTRAAIAGAIVYLLAHAAYKAALFLAAGVYDHELGTRRLSEIRGHARRLPLTSLSVLLAGLSMAGLPPALGYVGKEEALEGLLHGTSPLATAALLGLGLALALAVAYTIRIVVAALAGSRAEARAGEERPAPRPLAAGPAVLAVAGVALGLGAARLTPLVDAAVMAAAGTTPAAPLGLWHGLTGGFVTSLAVLAVGGALFAWWRARGWPAWWPADVGTRVFDRLGRRSRRLGAGAGRLVATPDEGAHVAAIVLVAIVAIGVGLARLPDAAAGPTGDSAVRWVVSLLLAAAAVIVARAPTGPASLATLAAVGFPIAAWYVVHGAPHLAAVQLVVDGITIALALFVVRGLPRTHPAAGRARRAGAGAIAVLGGVAFAGLAWMTGDDTPTPAGRAYVEQARAAETGNVLGSVLTEHRALDTLLETTVVAAAALGVAGVLRRRPEP